MPTNHIMDEKRVSETMRVLTYDEAKKGLAAAIGAPADDWDKSFGQYVEDHKGAKLIFCWYTDRVQVLSGRSNRHLGASCRLGHRQRKAEPKRGR
jgi:hypothetical protein